MAKDKTEGLGILEGVEIPEELLEDIAGGRALTDNEYLSIIVAVRGGKEQGKTFEETLKRFDGIDWGDSYDEFMEVARKAYYRD